MQSLCRTSRRAPCPHRQPNASPALTGGNLTHLTKRSPNNSQEELIQGEFAEPSSLQRAIDLVVSSGGVEAARQLARDEADKALAALAVLPPSRAKRSLELMVDYVLDRIY